MVVIADLKDVDTACLNHMTWKRVPIINHTNAEAILSNSATGSPDIQLEPMATSARVPGEGEKTIELQRDESMHNSKHKNQVTAFSSGF